MKRPLWITPALFTAALGLLSAVQPATAQRRAAVLSRVTFTATAGAYSAGQCLGGVLTVPNIIRAQNTGGAILSGVSFVDAAHNTAANDALTLLVFNAQPSGTYTDQAACAIAAADRTKFVGQLVIAASNCNQDSGPATTVCTITPSLPLNAASLPPTSSNTWVVPIVQATPTYGAISLIFNFMATPLGGN